MPVCVGVGSEFKDILHPFMDLIWQQHDASRSQFTVEREREKKVLISGDLWLNLPKFYSFYSYPWHIKFCFLKFLGLYPNCFILEFYFFYGVIWIFLIFIFIFS